MADPKKITQIKNFVLNINFLNYLSDDIIDEIYNQTIDFSKNRQLKTLQDTIDKAQAQIDSINSMTKVSL